MKRENRFKPVNIFNEVKPKLEAHTHKHKTEKEKKLIKFFI
jgi:hypothetical protein